MSSPLYRAERAIAALPALSAEKQTHYSRTSEHYSLPAEAEELAELAYGR